MSCVITNTEDNNEDTSDEDTDDKDNDDDNNSDDDDDNNDDDNRNCGCTAPPQNKADAMEEEEENDDNPVKITPAARNQECEEDRECDQELGRTINDSQNNLDEGEELGVAPPRRSEQAHRAATTMTHDKDFKPTTKRSHA